MREEQDAHCELAFSLFIELHHIIYLFASSNLCVQRPCFGTHFAYLRLEQKTENYE